MSYRTQAITISLITALLSTLLFTVGCSRDPDAAAQQGQKIRVEAIYATPIEEPWDQAIHDALKQAQEKLGVEYSWTDNVKPSEFEKTLMSIAAKRPALIVGDAFASEEITRRVARLYPDISFAFGSGLGPTDPNFSVFDNWIHEPAYVIGMIAAHLSKSGVIGAVGGFPVPEVNRLLNAYKMGAREVKPDIRFKVAFIGSWFDPPKAKEAAHTLMAQGVDVMYAERAGVIEACAEKGIPVFGNLRDQKRIAEEFVVTSAVWDMWPTIKHVIDGVRQGRKGAENLADWSMMGKGGARLAPFGRWEGKLDNQVLNMVAKECDEIITGRFRVPVDESEPRSDPEPTHGSTVR